MSHSGCPLRVELASSSQTTVLVDCTVVALQRL